MNLPQALFLPSGRVNRLGYWLVGVPLSLPLLLMDIYFEELSEWGEYFWLLVFPLAYPPIIIQIKRWHDRGKSGWWFLINLVPIAGPIWALVENGFLPGDEESNDFGPVVGQGQWVAQYAA